MGDVSMTVPVVRAFAKQHPDVLITYCSRPHLKAFFEDIPNLNFFEVDTKNKYKGFLGIYKWFQDLNSLGITHLIDFHEVLRTKVLRKLCGLNGIYTAYTDKARAEKKALIRPKNKVLKPLISIIDRHVDTLKKAGFDIVLNEDCFLTPIPIEFKFLENQSTTLIGIAPFAQYESKVYPLNLTKKVIEKILDKTDTSILLFGGGKKEIKLLKKLQIDNRITVVAGQMTLKEELNLISQLSLMMSMDSANGHMAAMMNIPVITLWGATHPYLGFVPFGQSLDNSITPDLEKYPKLPSSVYGKKLPKGYENAMSSIHPNLVVEKILENIKKQ